MFLRRNVLFALMVSATIFALAGCGKSSSLTSSDPALDPAPPAAPSSLSSTYAATVGYDYLYWNLSSSASVTGYEIWESATLGGTAVKVGTVGSRVNNLVLPNVDADCTRYYQVRARAASGQFSALSSAVAVDRHVVVSNQNGGINGSGVGGGFRIAE